MIPVNEPLLGEKELEYLTDCIQSGWVSSAGYYIDEFEKQWAFYCHRRYGIAVCNGSMALYAALAALSLNPGDEVILPAFTIISCANAIVENRCVPVLVDSNQATWTMDVEKIEEKITPRTKAIMPVHIYGHPVDMDRVLYLAQKYNLYVIEDAAEAHGASYKGEICGSFGDLSCFSFYGNKIITTGEGGMVLTNDEVLADRLKKERNLAFVPEKRFYHKAIGHNYRMTNMQAALGLAQLERIEYCLQKKRWMASAYLERLNEIDQLVLPVEEDWASNVYWMFGIVLKKDTAINAEIFARKLRAKGVDTRPFFHGMHQQPVYNDMGLFLGERYPVTEYLSEMGLYLPSGLTITEEQLDQVSDAVRKILHESA